MDQAKSTAKQDQAAKTAHHFSGLRTNLLTAVNCSQKIGALVASDISCTSQPLQLPPDWHVQRDNVASALRPWDSPEMSPHHPVQ
jgi:hypothetical protein